MKKALLLVTATLLFINCMAQEQLAFPFQGGRDAMNMFFRDSLIISPVIIQKKATGLVLFKFTADEKGKIAKIVIYYADDLMLAEPVIDALKKSNHKWVIPNHEKFHDFIIPFSFNLNIPRPVPPSLLKVFFEAYRNRKPIFTNNQVPLDLATLLPAVMINYDIEP